MKLSSTAQSKRVALKAKPFKRLMTPGVRRKLKIKVCNALTAENEALVAIIRPLPFISGA